MRTKHACLIALLTTSFTTVAAAQQPFNWRKYDGETINFLSSNHPWPNALAEYLPEFTKLTGINIKVDTYNEVQMRQRLTTLMQTKSSAVDLFLTTPSREGRLFTAAGYYKDLKPFLNDPSMTPADFDYSDFSPVLTKTSNLAGITYGIPLNIEGPVLSYRTDLFEACKLQPPATLEDLMTVAAALKACKPDIVPFSTRGLKEAINFTFGPMLFNFGGSYEKPIDGNYLCNAPGIKTAQFYADILKNYGPPGVSNYTFYQTSELMGQGRAAMTLESTNEYSKVASFDGRAKDVGVMVLPPGKDTGIQLPSVIGWHIAIPTESKKAGPAWFFILWATSKEMESRLVPKGVAPPRTSVFQSADFVKWASELPGRKQWLAALTQLAGKGTGAITPPTDKAPEMATVIGSAIAEVMLGQSDAKTAVCAAEPKIKELLTK